jgi:hypothetical protein
VAIATGEFDMKRASILVTAGLAMALAVPAVGLAQAPTGSGPNSAVTGMKPDRTTSPPEVRVIKRAKEEKLRKKRTECRAMAKAEKVSLPKRPAYVKKCMST